MIALSLQRFISVCSLHAGVVARCKSACRATVTISSPKGVSRGKVATHAVDGALLLGVHAALACDGSRIG